MGNEHKPQDETQDEVKETVKDAEDVSNELPQKQLDRISGGVKSTTFTLLMKVMGKAADQAARNR